MKKPASFVLFISFLAFSRPTTFPQMDTIQALWQGTIHMAQADIDSDGDCDWAAEHFQGRIAIILNNKYRTSEKIVRQTSVSTINSLDLGKANNDGGLDVLVAGKPDISGGNGVTMSVINAGASLDFADSVDIPTRQSVWCARFIDIDRDGDDDIVAVLDSATSSAPLRWYENTSGGWKEHEIERNAGLAQSSGYWIQETDIDKDSIPDIILGYTTLMTRGCVQLYRNNGDKTFAKTILAASLDTRCGAPIDIDLDGDVDLFFGKSLLINNNGSFVKDSLPNPPNGEPDAVAAGDVNGDGYPDCAASVYGEGIYLWQGIGRAKFTRSIVFTSDDSKAIGFADVDADHFIDITCLLQTSGVLGWLRNSGVQAFGPDTLCTVDNLSHFEVVDLDRDGAYDLISISKTTAAASGAVRVFQNEGNGVMKLTFTKSHSSSGVTDTAILKTGDFDRDSLVDYTVASGSSLKWYKQTDPTAFTEQPFISPALYPFEVGDINGDGYIDMFGRYYYSGTSPASSELFCYYNDGNGVFSRDTLFSLYTTPSRYPVAAVDIDRDNDLDIVTRVPETNIKSIAFYYNNGAQTFLMNELGNTDSLLPFAISPMDIDKDGQVDLLLASPDNTRFGILQNRGDINNDSLIEWNMMTVLRNKTMAREINGGDIDKDGRNDLVLFSAYEKDLGWLSQDTAMGFISYHEINFGQATGGSRIIDFDHDGWLDVLCAVGKYLILYRNLLGDPPVKPSDFTPTIKGDLTGPGKKASVKIHSIGPGKYAWNFSGIDKMQRLDLFRLNGSRIPVPITLKNNTCIADFGKYRGFALWIMSDERNKRLDQGTIMIQP
jgi:hypothetical protein